MSVSKVAGSLLCLVLLLGACATMKPQTPEQLYLRHRAVLKLAVQIGVVEFLHRHKALAQPVADIAAALRDELAGQTSDLDFLNAAVQQKMATMHLVPTEQLLVLNLMDALLQTMRTYFLDHDILPSQVLLRISEVVGWIAEAAQMQVAT
mgnify:FL=1